MKNNRLVGAVVQPLPPKVAYIVLIPYNDGMSEWMTPTRHAGQESPAKLPIAARRWAIKLGYYVQLYAHPFGCVASAWPDEKIRV